MSLESYLNDQQTIAMHLHHLLTILETCAHDDIEPAAHLTLIEIAKDMAKRLNNGLDSVNLPSGVIA